MSTCAFVCVVCHVQLLPAIIIVTRASRGREVPRQLCPGLPGQRARPADGARLAAAGGTFRAGHAHGLKYATPTRYSVLASSYEASHVSRLIHLKTKRITVMIRGDWVRSLFTPVSPPRRAWRFYPPAVLLRRRRLSMRDGNKKVRTAASQEEPDV